MEMGGVSIFGKYCKKILGGGSDKKFPQRKNQHIQYMQRKNQYAKKKFPQRKNFHNEKIISTTKHSIKNQKNFHNENINFYCIQKTKYKKPNTKNHI